MAWNRPARDGLSWMPRDKMWTWSKADETEFPFNSTAPLTRVPKGNENVCPHRSLYVNVHSSVPHKSQAVHTTRMSLDR